MAGTTAGVVSGKVTLYTGQWRYAGYVANPDKLDDNAITIRKTLLDHTHDDLFFLT